MKRIKGAAAVALVAGVLFSATAGAAEKESSSIQEVRGGVGTVQLKGWTATLVAEVELSESRRQALERIYQIVPELEELSLEGVHEEGEDAWRAILSDRAGEPASGIGYVHASLTFENDTGELIWLNIRNPHWASTELPDGDLAQEKAAEFVRQVLGDRSKDYRMGNGMGSGRSITQDDKGNRIEWAKATVQFERLINGIPFLNSGIQVGVDAAGHVTEYYTEDFNRLQDGPKVVKPDPTVFPAPSLAMPKETAAGLLEMQLSYVGQQPLRYPKPGSGEVETRPVLMYVPSFYMPIDAVTGQPAADFYGQSVVSRISLTGEGRQLAAGTPEEAAALVAAETGIDISGMKFNGVEEREEYLEPGKKVKYYAWSSEPQGGPDEPEYSTIRYLQINALADTGRIVGFSLQDEAGRGEKGTVTREAAQETAVQFMQRHLDTDVAELEMSVHQIFDEENIPGWVDRSKLEDYQQRPAFNFTFTRTHQGIPVTDRSYSVTVDGLTGLVTAFHDRNSSSSVILPDSRNAVTAEAAKAEFIKSNPLLLAYLWPEYYGQKAPAPLLVYLPDYDTGWKYIDALTGKTVTVEID